MGKSRNSRRGIDPNYSKRRLRKEYTHKKRAANRSIDYKTLDDTTKHESIKKIKQKNSGISCGMVRYDKYIKSN